MPIDAGVLICAGVSIILRLASGAWTDQSYKRFTEIPAHYDFRGNVTRLTPRKQGAWVVPVSFSILLTGFVALLWFIPADMQNGDPSQGIVLVSVTLLAAQGLILWLLAR
jgi:hypothetical protein